MRRDIDELAVSLAAGQSRRGTLKQLLLGAFGASAVTLGGIGLSEADAKNKTKSKKKVTLCQNGQTIKVNKKAKKKFLKRGATPGACQDTPACTPNANPCAGRECGDVDNGCGVQVPCGECTAPNICDSNTGVCGCTSSNNPCAGRECGTVDNGCGEPVSCGTCTQPDICNNNTGECGCTPLQDPCGDRVCGTVDDGCGTTVQCGPDSGNCPSPEECKEAAVCGSDGQCNYPDTQDDTPCGMNKCNHTCQSGVCTATPVVCPSGNLCQESTCDPNTGTCSTVTLECPLAPECQSGSGVCNPQTGVCSYDDAPDDTPCGMNKCNRTCQAGSCEHVPVVCPPADECQASICNPNDGTCSAPFAANQGQACNGGSGMCVNGTCEVTNTGTNSCIGTNPCLPPTFCDAGENCLCYSTIEGAGFCIDRTQAICPSQDVRPACASSNECLDSEVCVPLKENPDSTSSCCPSGQFPGFCVPLAARCV